MTFSESFRGLSSWDGVSVDVGDTVSSLLSVLLDDDDDFFFCFLASSLFENLVALGLDSE